MSARHPPLPLSRPRVPRVLIALAMGMSLSLTVSSTPLHLGIADGHAGADAGDDDTATCDFYTNDTVQNNCGDECGSCFNAGSRKGVMCNGAGSQTGYYCPADGDQGDITFACMDWTFGSSAMRAAEASFMAQSGEDVFFGVGTFGTADDEQNGLGACYRLTAEGVTKDIIAQSINTGHDVAGNQFDLQIGAGGAGAFNTCAGSDMSMYGGSTDVWGCQYGGVDNKTACKDLPEYPQEASPMEEAGDSLVALCEYSWDNNVRLSGAGMDAGLCQYNPTLLNVARVQCPSELVAMTWMQRSDEPDYFKAPEGMSMKGFPVDRDAGDDVECKSYVNGAGSAYCLTRMMDCRKPSGAFKDNVKDSLMVEGKKLVQTCTSDGYTRIDVQCGCTDCYC